MIRWFKRWLVSPHLAWHLSAIAVLLMSPALVIGWQLDDHFHRLTMLGHDAIAIHPLEVFSAVRGERVREYVDLGLFPWWTAPDFRLAFFRYLSAFSMWVDYQLWPASPALMHLHSLAWYGALVACVTLLYRRLLGQATWWAGLAAFLFAVDDAHVGPAAWLANRNALLAVVFGILSLWAFDRWRKDRSRKDAFLSPVFLAGALLSGEMGLATVGYLVAYVAFLETGCLGDRLRVLVPHFVVLVVWGMAYWTLGFGTDGSGFYLDPVSEPAAFLGAFVAHAPVLLLGQWTLIPADWATFFSDDRFAAFWLAGVSVLLVGAILFAPLVRRSATARFFSCGMVLSLVPVAAVAPANRVLLFVGVGAMGLLAEFTRGVVERSTWLPRARLWRVSAAGITVLLAATHVALAPLVSPVFAYSLKPFGDRFVEALATVPNDPVLATQDLVLVNPPDYLFLVSPIGTLKILDGQPYPRFLRALVGGTSPVEVTRLDSFSVRVHVPESIYGGTLGRLFRPESEPMRVGQRFDLTGMHVEVLETDAAGNPLMLLHRFDVPLEDPSLRWLAWDGTGYVNFPLPAIGESVQLPPAVSPFELAFAGD